jgi:hypothetical protein
MTAWEKVLARAMTADDPVAALRAGAKRLPAALRRQLARIDEDGFRISALLVARLRFERLLNASTEASDWFATEPEAFAQAFRRYHREVAMTAFFPGAEARLFTQWVRRNA